MPAPRPRTPAAGSTASAFPGQFWSRFLANVAAMAIVAVGAVWVFASRDATHRAELDRLQAQLDRLERDRDRSRALTDALAQQAYEAGVRAELHDWQREQAEQRLARAEALPQPAVDLVSPARAAGMLPPREPASAAPPEAPAPAPSPAAGEAPPAEAALPPAAPAAAPPPLSPLAELAPPSAGAGLDLADFDPLVPRARALGSQLDRDRAYATWKRTVEEAAAAECQHKAGEAARLRCADRTRRQLFPYGPAAVECSLSGNASPDYLPSVTLSQLPSHAVPLVHGAVILCDGALANP